MPANSKREAAEAIRARDRAALCAIGAGYGRSCEGFEPGSSFTVPEFCAAWLRALKAEEPAAPEEKQLSLWRAA